VFGNQSSQYTDGEGTSAKAKQIDLVTVLIVATQELVEFDDVPTETISERAAQQSGQQKLLRSHAIIVHGYLVFVVQIQSLVQTPHIGLVPLSGTIARAIGQQYYILHMVSPLYNDL